MKLISVGLFLYFVLIKFGTALECFSCAEDKCLNPDLWQKITNCGKTASGNHIGACLKEVYINADKKEITQRRCVIADKDASGKPTFACTNGQNKECKVCLEDLCNTANKIPAIASFLIVGVTIVNALI